MSIWGSIDLVHCWTDGCTGCDECEVGQPYVYDHSAVMPEPDARRGGYIDAAVLAKFVRYYRDNADATYAAEPGGYEPWLRLSVNDADVILDRRQVERIVTVLGGWLETVEEQS